MTSVQVTRVSILYGSETGTAEAVAYKLSSQIRMCGLACATESLDAYDVTSLPTEEMVIFVVSTAGDGETPADMRHFWRFLLRKVVHTTIAAMTAKLTCPRFPKMRQSLASFPLRLLCLYHPFKYPTRVLTRHHGLSPLL